IPINNPLRNSFYPSHNSGLSYLYTIKYQINTIDMKWVQKHRGTIVEVICFLFILLFVYAAVSKLLESQMFYDNIRNSTLLGGKTTASVASWLVTTNELCVALLIIRRKTRLQGLFGAFGLMFLFTAYIMAILFFPLISPVHAEV